MSLAMFNKLQGLQLKTNGLPRIVGASGSDLGVRGRVTCQITINSFTCNQEFLVCEYLKRHVILGTDFNIRHNAGVHWTKEGTRVLYIGDNKIAEEKEQKRVTGAPIFTTTSIKIPPRTIGTVAVEINTNSKDKVKLQPDTFCQYSRPHMVMFPLYADLSQRKKGTPIPFQIFNISNDENLHLPKDFIVGFAEKDEVIGEIFEVDCEDNIKIENDSSQGQPTQTTRRSCRNQSKTDIHKVFTTESNFIKSPAEVDPRRKVNLKTST